MLVKQCSTIVVMGMNTKTKRKKGPLEKYPAIRAFMKYSNSIKWELDDLPQLQREMIYTIVSKQNGCLYCTIGHGRKIFELSGDKKLYEDIVRDFRQAELEDSDRAMLEFVTLLNENPQEINVGKLLALKEWGFSEEAVIEILTHSSVMTAQNRFRMGLGFELTPGMRREASRLGLCTNSGTHE